MKLEYGIILIDLNVVWLANITVIISCDDVLAIP